MGAARPVVLAVALAACSRELPPYGEALVVVDTDVDVPRVASSLRVDTYALDGRWLESRTIARRDPRDWPASFSVQADTDAHPTDIVVRLRAFGAGVHDAFGEPRLVVGGEDVTPKTAPDAETTIDRLLHLHLSPGERGRVRVVLAASCAGAPAVVDGGRFATCTAGEGTVEPLATSPLEPSLDVPAGSAVGTAARAPCGSTAPGRVCVPGGAFVLGTSDTEVVPDADIPATPARVVRVSTFAIDGDEVSVGRYRAAVARGFAPPDAPECAAEADDFAMACLSWRTARAFCTFEGGDLPTEAEWEYAASSAGRSGKTMFPWGDVPPDCDRAIYGRLALAGLPGACEDRGPGPLAASAAPADRSILGVHGFGGGVAEWTRTGPARYDDACFRGLDPACEGTDRHVVRGGSWASPAIVVRSTARLASAKATAFIGFRCRYGAP